MINKKRSIGFFSGIFGLLGLGLAAFGVWLALTNQNTGPVLTQQPEAARNRVITMLDSLCSGDYETVSGCLYGKPSLGMDREAKDQVGRLFWAALADSF